MRDAVAVWDEERPPRRGSPSPRAKAMVVLVTAVATMLTLVLCCVAIREAARLIELDPRMW